MELISKNFELSKQISLRIKTIEDICILTFVQSKNCEFIQNLPQRQVDKSTKAQF